MANTFLVEMLEWMRSEQIMGSGSYTARDPHLSCKPKRVINVEAYGNDFADGSTEGGFSGDNDVTITWRCENKATHKLEIKPGTLMASLWEFMIVRRVEEE
jgi:hypothetical protein